MSGHAKKITRVLFHPTEDVGFSASSDKTVKVWNSATGAATHTLKDHTADVTGITVHATGEFLVSASSDKSWAFYDIATGTCRAHVKDPAVTAGFRSAAPARRVGDGICVEGRLLGRFVSPVRSAQLPAPASRAVR